jgi:UTP--glucose-1-phosphate uridylyltransferase
MSIATAVIPAAGLGTRLMPAAKSVPKELLPIVDRPVIHYVAEEAAAAGMRELVLITAPGKPALANYFSRDLNLEARLLAAGRQDALASINRLVATLKINFVNQPVQRGLGDAVLQARKSVGDRPFLCLLGDTIFSGPTPPARQLVDAFSRLGGPVIGLEEVEEGRVNRYGIVAGPTIGEGLIRIQTLVEKPPVGSAPSRLAIAARYVLTPEIFDCLENIPPDGSGEIQLTDALRELSRRRPLYGMILSSRRHDVGNPLDWLKTNLFFAAADPELWKRLEPTIRGIESNGELSH